MSTLTESKPAPAAKEQPQTTSAASAKKTVAAAAKSDAPKAKAAKASTADKSAKPVKAPKVSSTKEVKAKKPKLVRDSFTIPKDEYAAIESLKQRAVGLAHPVKKSELLRAGLKLLAGLSDSALHAALKAVPSIKTGRPNKEPAANQAVPVPKAKPAGKTRSAK